MDRKRFFQPLITLFYVALFVFGFNAPSKVSEPVFGPQVFVREKGSPLVDRVSFSADKPGRGYIMRLHNGGLDNAYDRVSSAMVLLNGSEVFGPRDFNQQIVDLEAFVNLSSTNTLEVELRSRPKGAIVIEIHPYIIIESPAEGQIFNSQPVEVSGRLHGAVASVDVNGLPAAISGTNFSVTGVPLTEGANILTATAVNARGFTGSDSVEVILDTTPPAISNLIPADGSTAEDARPTISADYYDSVGLDLSTVTLLLDKIDITPEAVVAETGISYTPEEDLDEGPHDVFLSLSDMAGNPSSASWQFTVPKFDSSPPVIIIEFPPDGYVTDQAVTPVYTVTDDLCRNIIPRETHYN